MINFDEAVIREKMCIRDRIIPVVKEILDVISSIPLHHTGIKRV